MSWSNTSHRLPNSLEEGSQASSQKGLPLFDGSKHLARAHGEKRGEAIIQRIQRHMLLRENEETQTRIAWALSTHAVQYSTACLFSAKSVKQLILRRSKIAWKRVCWCSARQMASSLGGGRARKTQRDVSQTETS